MGFPKPRSRVGVSVPGGKSWELPGKLPQGLKSEGFHGMTEQGTARDGEDGNSLPGFHPGGLSQGNPGVWDVLGSPQGVFPIPVVCSFRKSGEFLPRIPGCVWVGEVLRWEKKNLSGGIIPGFPPGEELWAGKAP